MGGGRYSFRRPEPGLGGQGGSPASRMEFGARRGGARVLAYCQGNVVCRRHMRHRCWFL